MRRLDWLLVFVPVAGALEHFAPGLKGVQLLTVYVLLALTFVPAPH